MKIKLFQTTHTTFPVFFHLNIICTKWSDGQYGYTVPMSGSKTYLYTQLFQHDFAMCTLKMPTATVQQMDQSTRQCWLNLLPLTFTTHSYVTSSTQHQRHSL